MRRIISDKDVVQAARAIGKSCTAKDIAAWIGGTDSRAVATAARKPVDDGRITRRYAKSANVAQYRFKRLTPHPEKAAGAGRLASCRATGWRGGRHD